jgi:hypothetical protein
MLDYDFIAELVQQDFNQLDFADQPMEKYCGYLKLKHINMVTHLVVDTFHAGESFTTIQNFIHGLNHIFFTGVAAGQAYEWHKNK